MPPIELKYLAHPFRSAPSRRSQAGFYQRRKQWQDDHALRPEGLSPIFALLGPFPDAADSVRIAVEFLAPRSGERVNLSAPHCLHANERLILQLLQSRINAARAGMVHAAGAFAKLLH